MRKIKLVPFLFSLGICFVAGTIGSWFTFSEIKTWYIHLNKPPLTPPNWIFGPVWSVLYIMMGISLYLVLIKKTNSIHKEKGLASFFIQLILNTIWSIIFFKLHSPLLAFFTIIMLWIAILQSIANFLLVSKNAAWLLTPYILWISFAAYLNYSIVILNLTQ